MLEDVAVAPYHDPDYVDWVYEQHEQGLYPVRLPARHYLGWAFNSCTWDGRGFFYEPFPRPDSDSVSLIMRVCGGKVEPGNRHPRIRTALYRFYDDAGELLYVGISGDPELRQAQHSKDKSWWPEVMDASIEWFNNRDVALDREASAIRREKPKYNVQHNQATA
ncbi:GIY-YIG nuclease family protein [Streptomyces formicae]|uniref:GIY-YIG nuclease family protein n=1 Tax=Streptomyces formicae TaxID=1616117 RepID=A0ABY3WQD5_9ACTN|nr:GIY-YIG nuclease family protein [Streptomyces formicae]UNM13796.1 GIY-YIG nuclease family protein [Streptomyces formicae]